MGAELVHAGQTDGRVDMTKLIGACRQYASVDVCHTKKILRYEVWSFGPRVCKGADLFWTEISYAMHDFFMF